MGRRLTAQILPELPLRASEKLDEITFNRVRRNGLLSYDDNVQDLIKLATCSIAEALSLIDTATDGTGVITTSESIGGAHSTTIDKGSIDKIMVDAIKRAKQYLWSTKLISAGVVQ